MPAPAIYACDVGSTRIDPRRGTSAFAWVRAVAPDGGDLSGGHDIRALVAAMAEDLSSGRSLALGFEAPLFLPVPADADQLSRGRPGEGNRSFAAPAALTVAALAVHQAGYILRGLRAGCRRPVHLTTDWREWPRGAGGRPVLLCWEAFVAGPAAGASHLQDAATAAMEFAAGMEKLDGLNAIDGAERPLSLIGAVALWAGWSYDIDILHRPTLVVRAVAPWTGPVRPWATEPPEGAPTAGPAAG